MTAFVLVSGPFTGGWVWDEVVARLRKAGAAPYPVTLTGMADEDGTGASSPDADQETDRHTDLETHIADVLATIDRIPLADEVVLVGHDYGIHPVLGAADRRSGRVARVVYLDAGLPRDGDPASAFVPEASAVGRADASGGGTGLVPAPAGDEWAGWGSTEGLSAADLARLDRLAAPQPVRTLTQPLRLTGDPFGRPTTGVLCTANGASIATVQMLVTAGPAHFRVLAAPTVGYFELATGHWPMLSAPGPLAEVLLRAAADEGERLSVPDTEPLAGGGTPFLLDVEERPRERHGRVDLHLPEGDADAPRPAVLFVHGGPVRPDQRPTPRDSAYFLGYGRYAAGLGVVGATLDHRLYGLADYPLAAEDVAEAVELLRAHPRVDGDRIALWFFSAGGLLAADWLAAPPPWLRCVALNYPVLAPMPDWRQVGERFRPAEALSAASPPVVLTRAGLEHPPFQETVDGFLAAAERTGAEVELIDLPLAHHGFEAMATDHTPENRAGAARAAASVVRRLTAPR
ncbi:alpha/beta hydrolase [Streptomyces sp. NPDC048623]|uniref:alpha/beta hydrolase n=1 Tax=Streptomyces sp. NPDC048623 TaxID=3155761 RepID=UPI003424F4AA